MARRHNFNYNESLLFRAIKNLIYYCFDFKEFSFKILSESDLKCFLYSELINSHNLLKESNVRLSQNILKRGEVIGKKPSKKRIRCPLVVTEVLYDKEYISGTKKENLSHFCDLVIFDKDEIEFFYEYRPRLKINEVWEYKLSDYIDKSVFIELKWRWGKNAPGVITQIRDDLKKLNQRFIKRRYLIYFDQSGNLSEEDILSITKNKGHKIIYIDNLHKKLLTYPKSLKDYIVPRSFRFPKIAIK